MVSFLQSAVQSKERLKANFCLSENKQDQMLYFSQGNGLYLRDRKIFKSLNSSFFNILRVAKKFINFIVNPGTHLAQTLTL